MLRSRPGYSADIFSWACTMVYAATGHRAFPGETVPALVNAILYREPDLSGFLTHPGLRRQTADHAESW